MFNSHQPVLFDPVISSFKDKNLKVFIDGTLGAGGHAQGLLEAHPEIETYIGFDQDLEALAIAKKTLEPWGQKVHFIQDNFETLEQHLNQLNIPFVDGILLDLGVSSMQLDEADRGFSFSKEGPLDMRMNKESSLTAAEILNNWSEKDLGDIFLEFGEETHWNLAARKIVKKREEKLFQTTADLSDLLYPVLSRFSKRKHHPLTLIFQALRIAVNREIEVVKNILPKAVEKLSVGGRLSVISFHSLEDRIVKDYFRFAATGRTERILAEPEKPIVKLLTRKPIIADSLEIEQNPRSRSSKLRTVEKLP